MTKTSFEANQLALYLVTDRACLGEKTLYAAVEAALKAGVSFLQYREKQLPFNTCVEEATALKQLAKRYGVPFVVNDSLELAIAVNADGIHIGQSDVSPLTARAKLGPEKIIGVTARTVAEAQRAADEGADYLGSGAAFETGTKQDTRTIGPAGIAAICQSVDLPVVAIGGIQEDNLMALKNSGVQGVAVVSAILGKDDPAVATGILYQEVLKLRESAVQGGSR